MKQPDNKGKQRKNKHNKINTVPKMKVSKSSVVKCRLGHTMEKAGTITLKTAHGTTKNEFLYHCTLCDQLYISSFDFKDGAVLKTKLDRQIVNIYTQEMKENLKKLQQFENYTIIFYNDTLCYCCTQTTNIPVHVITSKGDLSPSCTQCGGDTKTLLLSPKGRNFKHVIGVKCSVCGQNYVKFGIYLKNDRFIAENQEEVEEYIKGRQERRQKVRAQKMQVILHPDIPTIPEHITQYLACDVQNTASGIKEKIIVADKNYVMDSSHKIKITTAQDSLGTIVLKAVANDKNFFDYKGAHYRILKYVRYDAAFVSQYKTPYQHKEIRTKTKNNPVRYHDGSKTTVYVYFHLTNLCMQQGHAIETVTMQVKDILTSSMLNINIYHCTKCDRYFMNHEMLAKFIQKHQHPAFHYSVVRDTELKLNPMSELMMYGYNVKEGILSDFERQQILRFLIDAHLITKQDIIRSLQFKVDYNGKKTSNANAKAKWMEDIRFVSQYGTEKQRKINGKLVRDK